MAACRRVYDSRPLQADCRVPGSALEPHARQSIMGYLSFTHTTQNVLIRRPQHKFEPPILSSATKLTLMPTHATHLYAGLVDVRIVSTAVLHRLAEYDHLLKQKHSPKALLAAMIDREVSLPQQHSLLCQIHLQSTTTSC